MFGLTFEKLIIIGVIAAFVIGPERLPHYASLLAKFVRQARDFANGAKTRMKEEMGPEFDEVEWKKLDPRQYDPRRIIRDALLEDPAPSGGLVPKPSSPMAPATAASGAAATAASVDPEAAVGPLGGDHLGGDPLVGEQPATSTGLSVTGGAAGLAGHIDEAPAYLSRKKNLDRDAAAPSPYDSEAT